MLDLYPFQRTLVTDASNAFRTHQSVLIVSPTGTGKTIMAADIALQLARDHETCLYLVHRRELVSQTRNTLHEFGLGDQVGIIAAGYPETPWAPFQIAQVQTLVKRLERLTWLRPRMLFIDEAHHIRAKTWEQILNWYPQTYRLLLTATPERLDGKGLKPYCDIMLEAPQIGWMMANGYLAEMETFHVPGGLPSAGLRSTGGDYSPKQMAERVDGPMIASAVKNILRYAGDRRSLFYAVSIQHSKQVVADLNFQGMSAEHVDGDTPFAQREASMRRFSEGTTQLLSNVALFTEGIDVPECDCVIHGRWTKSTVLYRQANGRAMRKKADGRKGRIVDLVDVTYEHGLPEEDMEWTLEDGAETTAKKRAKGNTRQCAGCNHMYPARHPVCPLCGHEHQVRTPNEIDVDLELARAAKKDEQKRRGEMARELNRKVAATLGDPDELRRLQIEYGRKPAVIHVWNRVFEKIWDRRKRELGLHGNPSRYA